MADDTKPTNPTNQPKPPIETPKDIEDLLKDLPKINTPQSSSIPQNFSPLNKTPESVAKSPSPLSPPLSPPPQPTPPLKPLIPPTAQTPPALPAPSAGQDKFKSLIRTMGEDLESAKKGMKFDPKPFEIKQPPTSPKPITPPPKPLLLPSEIKLGPAQRTKALNLPKPATPFTDVTRAKKYHILKIIIPILVIGTASAGIWYFMTRQKETVTVIPTFTPTPTPILKNLSELIPFSSQITISSTENFLTALNNGIKSMTLTNGSWIALKIIDESGAEYTLDQIFQKLNIALPNGILENLDSNEWFLAVYGQREMYDLNGALSFGQTPKIKLGLIAKANYPTNLRSSLNSWEIIMEDNLKDLFGFNPQKIASEAFLDNFYNGTQIRYKNFPYADSTIDYAILNLAEFNSNYFIITNSRESIYSAIDLLQNQ